MQTKRRRECGEARPADAPCRSRTPAREGRGAWAAIAPDIAPYIPGHPDPASAAYPQARAGSRGALRSRTRQRSGAPTPSSSQGGGKRVARGCKGGRVRGPGGALRDVAHPEQLPAGSGDLARDLAANGGLAFRGSPPPQAERAGGGPGQGNPIPQHRPRSKPAPNFPSGVVERGGGQFGSLARIAATDRTAQGTTPSHSTQHTLPQPRFHLPASPSGRRGCEHRSPRSRAPSRQPARNAEWRSDGQLSPRPRSLPEQGDKAAAPGSPQPLPRARPVSLTSCAQLDSPGAALALDSDHGPLLARTAVLPPACPRAAASPPRCPLLPPPLGPDLLRAPGLGFPAPPRRVHSSRPVMSPPP